MEQQEIKILARPQMNPAKCDFQVDRPVADGVVLFPDEASAKDSPLPTELFALPGVEQVLIRGNVVTITKDESAPWTELAKKVGATIRSQMLGGGPLVAEGVGGGTAKDEDIRTRVAKIVDEEINPAIAAHGGFVEITDVKGGIVYVKMGGGCQGCASSMATLHMGIEQSIRASVPEVLEILDVTDHTAGQNPYYGNE